MSISLEGTELLDLESTLIFLSIIQGDEGYSAAISVSDSLMDMGPDRAAFIVHSWVGLLNDLMDELLEHVDNDHINMYIH